MARSFRRMQEYEKEIKEMLVQRMTHREIGEALRKKGIPARSDKITEAYKVGELKYMLARKEAKVKQLEMENELMRNFLSLTGRR